MQGIQSYYFTIVQPGDGGYNRLGAYCGDKDIGMQVCRLFGG